MAGVVWIQWYASLLRQDDLALEVAQAAPITLRYGARRYAVHRSRDDRYKITQMAWFESKTQWYSYWDGPEMIAFRRRNSGRFQIPATYVWQDELVAGELGPEVAPSEGTPAPEPAPTTSAT